MQPLRRLKNMSDIMKKEHRDILDLTKYNSEPLYLCDECGVYLLSYPAAQLTQPYAKGPFYICPKCHMVTDIAKSNPPHADDIQPIDVPDIESSLTFIPEDKEVLHRNLAEPIDPEPQDEERIKNQGGTIISKRVIAKRDY